MVFNKDLTVIPKDIDRYGRIVGMIYIGDKCLNEELIKSGFAWTYTKYCKESFCDKFLKLDKEARQSKIGLWIDKNPTPPWEYRKRKTNKTKNIIPGEYHGNVSSHVFHASSCKYFNCKSCRQVFQDRKLAVSEGYRPCGLCKP